MKTNRGLTMTRMMKLGRVSRSGFYRLDGKGKSTPDSDMGLRDAIQRIALEWPSYGRPRIHSGTAPAGLDSEPEAGLPDTARG